MVKENRREANPEEMPVRESMRNLRDGGGGTRCLVQGKTGLLGGKGGGMAGSWRWGFQSGGFPFTDKMGEKGLKILEENGR